MTDTRQVDVDLDALAPAPKRILLNDEVWKLPGDLPMELFFRFQGYEQRTAAGEDEYEIVKELTDEILALFKVHQPKMAALPSIGLKQLVQLIGAVYGGGGEPVPGEAPPPNRAARRQQKARTTSKPRPSRRPATSR